MYKRRTSGFTLIELLVVIAIIALLMSILMPALQRVKLQAKSVACISKLKQWGLFFSMYAEDNNSRFMMGSPSNNRWVYALRDYYKWDDEFTCCPNATKPWRDENGIDSGAEGHVSGAGVTMAWGYMRDSHWHWQGEQAYMKGSYGINGWVVDPPAGDEPHNQDPSWFWRGPSVAGAGYVPLFLEAQRYNGWALETDTPPTYSGEEWDNDAQMGRYCLDRHDGFAGCLFLDFSARKVGLKELWTLKWHRQYNQAGPWTLGGGVVTTDWPEWMQNLKDY
jgi:prepilin-type N-terminal cleavage/methylation domain-containing protein